MALPTDPAHVVTALLHHATTQPDKQYVVPAAQTHSLLIAELRARAGISDPATSGHIMIKIGDVAWRILVTLLSAGRIELSATPAPAPV